MKNECGGSTSVKALEPPPGKREARVRKIDNRGRKIEFADEPRFNGVLVGRDDVQQMASLERTDVVGYRFTHQ
jgi:hypothetical protein